jgi:hypothetical protein
MCLDSQRPWVAGGGVVTGFMLAMGIEDRGPAIAGDIRVDEMEKSAIGSVVGVEAGRVNRRLYRLARRGISRLSHFWRTFLTLPVRFLAD